MLSSNSCHEKWLLRPPCASRLMHENWFKQHPQVIFLSDKCCIKVASQLPSLPLPCHDIFILIPKTVTLQQLAWFFYDIESFFRKCLQINSQIPKSNETDLKW